MKILEEKLCSFIQLDFMSWKMMDSQHVINMGDSFRLTTTRILKAMPACGQDSDTLIVAVTLRYCLEQTKVEWSPCGLIFTGTISSQRAQLMMGGLVIDILSAKIYQSTIS